MENALSQFKRKNDLSFRKIAMLVGYRSQVTVLKHCSGVHPIPAEAAIKYNSKFGIPLSDLRPDLWPPEASASSQVADKEPA